MPASAGIGLRAQHHADVIEQLPRVGWFEAHAENYFAEGGGRPAWLERVREHYPVSLHGVGLSLGSADPLDSRHLEALKRAVRRFEPALVSEHLSWSSVGGRFANDLLPLPYTEEAVRHVAARIGAVQDFIGRQILIENVSSYFEYCDSRMPEWEFVAAVAVAAGCGVLLDLNNVYVAARNHGFDPGRFLNGIPRGLVQEFHLAGHATVPFADRELLVDTHDAPVCAAVWDLYRSALLRFGTVPVLIEWDSGIPPLPVLAAEAHKADAVQTELHADAA
jgi:uncharacterized protein (UPF0276 family)